MTRLALFPALASLLLLLASSLFSQNPPHTIPFTSFGKTSDGQSVRRYVLHNDKGIEAVILTYGATLNSLKTPDRNGNSADIVLGYDDLAGYEADKSFFGASIGRYGNRIAKGTFTLDGNTYHLPINDGPNSLHGGTPGFNKRVWTATDRSHPGAQVLELSYTSKDGENGYPGTLHATVTYTLPSDSTELRIDYRATTDKDTVLNLTNHSYFNLTADPAKNTILDHLLLLHASRFTPVDATLIPTGELRPVAGTPFDFTKATAIGARINDNEEQLKFGKGYDHNWVLNAPMGKSPHIAAEVYDPKSGRTLSVWTTEPGVQFYSGNFLDGTVRGKGGVMYGHRTGLCLETQHFPDSPNHPNFPSTELKPGQTFQSATILRFGSRKE